MALEKEVQSTLAKMIAARVKVFLQANVDATKEDGTVEIGNEMIAQAIAYAISITWGSPDFLAASMDPSLIAPPAVAPAVTSGVPTYGKTLHDKMTLNLQE